MADFDPNKVYKLQYKAADGKWYDVKLGVSNDAKTKIMELLSAANFIEENGKLVIQYNEDTVKKDS